MSSLTSPRPDSGVSVQDTESAQLKQENELSRASALEVRHENEQLRASVRVMMQERDDARKESLTFLGASARHTREKQASDNTVADLRKQLEIKDKDLIRANTDHASSRKKLREMMMQPPPPPPAELAQLQHNYVNLKKLHADTDCESFSRVCKDQVEEAQQLTKAAEYEAAGLRHLGESNHLMKEQEYTTNAELLRLLAASRGNDATIALLRGQCHDLKAELDVWRPARGDWDQNLEKILADDFTKESVTESEASESAIIDCYIPSKSLERIVPSGHPVATKLEVAAVSLVLSTVQSVCITPQAKWTCAPFAANVSINLSMTDRKHWTLMQRVQSVISAKSKLDIHGTQSLIKDFVKGMDQAEADHAHWHRTALNSLEEIEALRKRPLCNMPSHRNLVDELAAKDLQLQMQTTLVAQWQNELAQSYANVNVALANLHTRLAKGTCLCGSQLTGRRASR